MQPLKTDFCAARGTVSKDREPRSLPVGQHPSPLQTQIMTRPDPVGVTDQGGAMKLCHVCKRLLVFKQPVNTATSKHHWPRFLVSEVAFIKPDRPAVEFVLL